MNKSKFRRFTKSYFVGMSNFKYVISPDISSAPMQIGLMTSDSDSMSHLAIVRNDYMTPIIVSYDSKRRFAKVKSFNPGRAERKFCQFLRLNGILSEIEKYNIPYSSQDISSDVLNIMPEGLAKKLYEKHRALYEE